MPVINIIGGNTNRKNKLMAGLSRAALNCRALIIDSGIQTGIEKFCLRKNLNLIGIAPENQIEHPKNNNEFSNKILTNGHTHFILLGKDEVVLWCYDGVTMWQEKVKREMVGSHSGFSFRVAKGVTYRTGGFKGHPVEHSYMDNAGTGSLYITNKHIIFHSSMRSVKIPYKKIIGLNPYQDGMGVQQDGANAKRLVFQGFDCSFVMNVMSFISV